MSNRIRQLVFLILFLSFYSTSNAQGVVFVRKNKSFQLPNPHLIFHPIGVVAGKDTLLYTDDPSRAWTITMANADSLRVSRPIRWRDTLVNRQSGRYPDGFQYWKDVRINGKKMTRLIAFDTSETKAFSWTAITAIYYPTYSGKGNGCMGCLLIPGFNIGFIIWAHQRWKPRWIKMNEWSMSLDLKVITY
jgi:hypothetical protein